VSRTVFSPSDVDALFLKLGRGISDRIFVFVVEPGVGGKFTFQDAGIRIIHVS